MLLQHVCDSALSLILAYTCEGKPRARCPTAQYSLRPREHHVLLLRPAKSKRTCISDSSTPHHYACAAWSPHTAKGIPTVESVQRRAARFVFNDYQRSTSVSSLINELNWLLLQERRTLIDLTLFYKIQYNLVLLPFPNDLTLNTSCTRKSHNKTYKLLPALVDPDKNSFFARCITVWNSLPLEAVSDQSLSVFKAIVNSFLFPAA